MSLMPRGVRALPTARSVPPDEDPSVPSSRPGRVTPPLRIIAAVVGAALVAVPLVVTTTRHTSPKPARQQRVAEFRVQEQDMPGLWGRSDPGDG